jgi:dihydroorotase
MQVHIRKARVIDPQSVYHDKVVDLLVEDGVIKNIAGNIKPSAPDQVIAAKGLCVSPGWVDILADYREPGFEHKETIHTGMNAAASGGFTDVLLAPNTQPVLSTKSIIQYVLKQAAGHAVSLHPLGAATQNAEGKELAEMIDMHSNGAIAFSDGWKPVQNAGLMLKALEYVKAFNGTIVQIPTDTALSAGGLMNESVVSTLLGLAGIPVLAESIIVHRDIELLRYTQSKLHITGITTEQSVELVRNAKAEGLQITCSVTPYHLALTEEALTSYNSMYKVMPPLRSEEDRMALIAGIQDGTIDCIASHHRPQEWDAKTKEFEYAADGMSVQELTFNILWDTLNEYITEERIVELLAIMPRDIFGMGQVSVTKGQKANLTLFTTTGTHTLTTGNILSKSKNNPFAEKELAGKVLGIISNGRVFFNQ